jgi:hypothetical protein
VLNKLVLPLESLVVNHASIAVATSGRPYVSAAAVNCHADLDLIRTSAVAEEIPELFLLLVDTLVSVKSPVTSEGLISSAKPLALDVCTFAVKELQQDTSRKDR